MNVWELIEDNVWEVLLMYLKIIFYFKVNVKVFKFKGYVF